MSATGDSSVLLTVSKRSTIRVAILITGLIVAPAAMLVQPPIAGHDVMDVPVYSFPIENEAAGKKILYDLGIMKAWEAKQPPHGEFYPLSSFLIRGVRISCRMV